jgi:RNA polymerase sigma factor (sigma-70 family)
MRARGVLSTVSLPVSSVPPASPDVAELYRLHGSTVVRWAARLGGPAVDADDVAQEVFMVARQRLRQPFEGPGAITTWLFRTTQRVVLSHRRKARLRRLLARLPLVELAPVLPKVRSTPLESLERGELVARMHRLLDQLPDRQREVLILFEVEGLTTHEIAELVGTRVGTVRVWLHRARGRFADLFAKEEP